MHEQWKRTVLESYPKYFLSPEREATGLGSIIERRKEMTREVDRAFRRKAQRSSKR